MKQFLQFCLIVLLIEVSSIVLSSLNITRIPVAIFALIIMFVLLNFRVIKHESIEGISQILMKNMGLFFVPLGVRIIADIDVLEGSLVSVLFIIIIATIISQLAIALVAKFVFATIYRVANVEVPR